MFFYPSLCGIYFTTSPTTNTTTLKLTQRRGLTSFTKHQTTDFFIAISVLSIRSVIDQTITTVPIAYNGEIYNNDLSDTLYIQRIIKESIYNLQTCFCVSQSEAWNGNKWMLQTNKTSCFCVLKRINDLITDECEMAVLFVHKNNVYFFKDDIGRKSLGYTIHNNQITISSVNFNIESDPKYFYIFNIPEKILYREKKAILKYNIPYIIALNTDYTLHFINLMIEAIKKRCHSQPNVILFSGGIDSVLITALLHNIIDINLPIYLINTQFITNKTSFDRVNGRHAFDELKSIFPRRDFIFIENDISIDTLKLNLPHISTLIYPKTSVMDQNIGGCLFFSSMKASNFTNIIFVGSGADELFCGYLNHTNELNLKVRIKTDVENLYNRNLGRDDRVISDNNVESRYPYLDVDIVRFVYMMPANCFYGIENGVTENKAIIRNALRKVGVVNVCNVRKKAMQFGSGISKLN